MAAILTNGALKIRMDNGSMFKFSIGDRVRHRRLPYLTGTVWDVGPLYDGDVVVDWDDDDDECIYVRPELLECIRPALRLHSGSRA